MAEPEVPEVGEIAPRKKPGFGTYIIIGVIVALVIGAVMLVTGGNDGDKPANTSPTTPATTIPQLQSSIDSLNAQVSGFSGRLANLESQVAGISAPTVTQADIDSLQASINSLSGKLAVLNATVANFTGTGNGDTNVTPYAGETSRWYFDSNDMQVIGYDGGYLTFKVIDIDPSKIKDEGLYEVVVKITNTDTTTSYFNTTTNTTVVTHNAIPILLDYGLKMILTPRDYCMVDEGSTYLDSDYDPYLNWDADFVVKERQGQKTCREIVFTSKQYNFGTLNPSDSIELELVLELYYA